LRQRIVAACQRPPAGGLIRPLHSSNYRPAVPRRGPFLWANTLRYGSRANLHEAPDNFGPRFGGAFFLQWMSCEYPHDRTDVFCDLRPAAAPSRYHP
jgi:hypothetical protein